MKLHFLELNPVVAPIEIVGAIVAALRSQEKISAPAEIFYEDIELGLTVRVHLSGRVALVGFVPGTAVDGYVFGRDGGQLLAFRASLAAEPVPPPAVRQPNAPPSARRIGAN